MPNVETLAAYHHARAGQHTLEAHLIADPSVSLIPNVTVIKLAFVRSAEIHVLVLVELGQDVLLLITLLYAAVKKDIQAILL